MQNDHSSYTNSPKTNVISVWNFSKEVKLVPSFLISSFYIDDTMWHACSYLLLCLVHFEQIWQLDL